MSNNVNLYKLAGILDSGSAGQILTSDGAGNFSFATLEIPPSGLDSASAIALQTPQDFAYASLTGTPNILDSANVIALQTPQDFAYSSLTGTPNVLDSSNVSTLITTAVDALVAGAPGALDTLNELATALNDDSNAIAAITNTLTLKLNIADVVAQDFAYTSLTGTPNVLDSADVVAIASALGGVDSAAITSMIDSNYVSSRVTLAYAGSASVENIKFVADSGQTIFNGLSYSDQLVQVYLNGVLLLDSDDYVKSGNNTITLTQAAATGDQLVVSDFTAFFTAPGVDSSAITSIIDSAYVIALSPPQDFAYASLTGAPNILDSADVIALSPPLDLSAINQSIIPDTDSSYDLGDPTHKFKSLYLSGNTIYLGNIILSAEGGLLAIKDSSGAVASIDPTSLIDVIDSAYVSSRVTLAYAGSASVENIKFVADSGQTIFNGLSYNNQLVQVYLNGVLLLDSDDYVKSGNNTITLTQAATIGDQLVVSDFTAFFAAPGLDSSGVISIIDSAYVIALSPPQDFAYASLTGVPSSNNAIALNQAGTLAVTTGTVRWYAPAALTVNSIVARLGTAADATVTAVAKKNGSTAATTSITAGQTAATNNTGFSMVTGDYLTLDITTIGSTNKGADLNVQFLYAFN